VSTLDVIGARHGTDKTPLAGPHDYCRFYDQLFAPLRDEPITLLEIGFGGYHHPTEGGHSARMWREYFTRASINIVDNCPKTITVDGVQLFCGEQDDESFLAEVHNQTGDFDIVIDDASHWSDKTLASYSILWPHVKSGGLYVVEDISVQKEAADHFVRLADELIYARDGDIDWIAFFREMAILRKR
jgi:8-demethyl-8-(2-methoxy-alpha-L-rhamnosyl)tetracenomycin-C 3'-O-methyltransferase